ncbi:MAG: ABC transporter permease [Limnochordaceae bacterium]|nr:ABC transporter permease [Limnochordaceae bacterium]
MGRIRSDGWVIGLSFLVLVASFLTWATAGQSLNLLGMLQATLVRAVPITLAALSGVMSERSGVVNIAIEGMMLGAAFTSVVASAVTGSLLVGVGVAVVTGALLAWVHGVLAIRYRVDQIVSGTVINIFATGMTSYLSARFLQHIAWLNNAGTFPNLAIPGLSRIPVIGPLLFSGNVFFFATVVLVITLHVVLFRTRFGLRVRAVGEHPRAADTLGIRVERTRYISVLLSGMIAGLGGAYFTLGSVGRFDELMTAGRGFIGLAAMIFGKWTPVGALGASLLFGFADSLQTKLQILGIPIPSEFLLMAPYIATIIVVSGIVGRALPPAADGQPYEK